MVFPLVEYLKVIQLYEIYDESCVDEVKGILKTGWIMT